MKTYSAYSQIIQSDSPLPMAEVSHQGSPDITVSSSDFSKPKSYKNNPFYQSQYLFNNDNLHLYWNNVCSLYVKDGKEILFMQDPDSVDKTYPGLLIAGTAMAVVLFQKGFTVLHGSCVKIDGKAFIFLGHKGEGKSTMAGYFASTGHQLISDDVCAISFLDDSPLVHQSFPSIKLWPDAMDFLNLAPAEHGKVHKNFEKRNVKFNTRSNEEVTELGAIILLQTAPDVTLEKITGTDALVALLQQFIINRFQDGQSSSVLQKIYFQATNLLQKVPFYSLSRPRNHDLLPSISDKIIDELGRF